MQHECDTSDMSETRATRVKNFGFEKIFLHPCIYYMASERVQGEEQFHSKNCLLEMPCFHDKMHLKSAPQKLEFLMTKAVSKICTLDCSCKCPCTFPHSYAQ